MENLIALKEKLVKLYLFSGREVQGRLKEIIKPDQTAWQPYQEEVVLHDHGQEICVRSDRIEGYVIL